MYSTEGTGLLDLLKLAAIHAIVYLLSRVLIGILRLVVVWIALVGVLKLVLVGVLISLHRLLTIVLFLK